MSMREPAEACKVDAAATYHYFDSNDAPLQAVIEERRYPLQLNDLPPVDRKDPLEAVTDLIVAVRDGITAEEEVWRLLLGESLRGTTTALAQSAIIPIGFETAIATLVDEIFPERTEARRDLARTLILDEMCAALLEHLFRPP
jgi:AcrR family transcriptional regulator